MAAMVSRLRASPRWTLLFEGRELILSGGADELYLLDEVSAVDAPRLLAAFEAQADAMALEALGREPGLALVMTRLERLGALERGVSPTSTLKVRATGSALAVPLVTQIAGMLPRLVVPVDDGAQLTLVVRTSGTLMESVAAAPSDGPHVLVDLAYHHTMSVGPLVWPGETACLQCLAGRIRQAWGDPAAPAAPRATVSLALAAGFSAEVCRRFASDGGHAELVEHVVAIDLRTLEARRERVHRLPWCPRCFPEGTPVGAGSFALPWSNVAAGDLEPSGSSGS